MRRYWLAIVVVALLNPATREAAAQRRAVAIPILIPDSLACETCRIVRERIAVIRDDEFPGGALQQHAMVHVTSDSTFFVSAGSFILDELYHADRSGRITRRIGGSGDGPGEFRTPWYVSETDTSFVVTDPRLARLTFLSKRDLDLVGTARLAASPNSVAPLVFADGLIVLRADVWTRNGAGLPYHVLDRDGSLLRSIGSVYGPGQGPDVGAMATSGDSAFWVVHKDDYLIQLWKLDGALLGTWRRTPAWFRSRDRDPIGVGDRYNYISQIHEDENGRLWVKINELTRAEGGRNRTEPSAFSSIIEVLDPRRGQLLAVNRRDGVRESPTHGSGFFQRVQRVTGEGLLTMEIWASRLDRGRTPQFRRKEPES